MRKVVSAVVGALGVAAIAFSPAFAEYDFCLTDPAVSVNGHTVDVGLYTHDADLVQPGGVAGPMLVVLQGGNVSTNVSQWSAVRSTNVIRSYPSTAMEHDQLTVDAFVPSTHWGDSFFIKVTFPDGHVATASGRVNTFVTLRVPVS